MKIDPIDRMVRMMTGPMRTVVGPTMAGSVSAAGLAVAARAASMSSVAGRTALPAVASRESMITSLMLGAGRHDGEARPAAPQDDAPSPLGRLILRLASWTFAAPRTIQATAATAMIAKEETR